MRTRLPSPVRSKDSFSDFRPQLFQRPRRRLVRVPFGIIWSPRHVNQLPSVSHRKSRADARNAGRACLCC